MKDKNLGCAYVHLKKLLEPSTFRFAAYVVYELYSGIIGDEALFLHLKWLFKRPSTEDLLHLAIKLLMVGYPRDATNFLRRIERLDNCTREQRIFAAMVMDMLVENAAEIEREWLRLQASFWRKAIDMIVTDSLLLPVSGSRVFTTNDVGVSSEVVVLKEDKDRSALALELEATRNLQTLAEETRRFRVASPVALLKRDEHWYYISRHATGSLLDALRGSKAVEAYEGTARALATIHRNLKSKRGHRDMRTVIEKRLLARAGIACVESILDNWSVSWDAIAGDMVFDKDAHPRNWIVTNYGDLVAIDNSDKGYVPQEFDLVKLTERCDFFMENPKFKSQVVEVYFDEYGGGTGRGWLSSYQNAIILMALNYLLVGDDAKIKRMFVANAEVAIHALIGMKADVDDARHQKYSCICAGLNTLLTCSTGCSDRLSEQQACAGFGLEQGQVS